MEGLGKFLASASTQLTAINKSQQNLIHQTCAALRQMESEQLMDPPRNITNVSIHSQLASFQYTRAVMKAEEQNQHYV